MDLAVVGAAMVSPLGTTPAEHAFFVRAGVGPAAPGAFVDEEGETMNVAYCPWLEPKTPLRDRVLALGMQALEGALGPWERRASAPEDARERAVAGRGGSRTGGDGMPLLLTMAAHRPELGKDERDSVERALSSFVGTKRAIQLTGAAGFYWGLGQADKLLGHDAEAVALLATDSLVGIESLAAYRREATTPWMANLPRPAEAAAALVVCKPETARREGLEVLATITHSRCQTGEAHDDNDAIVDGVALTQLLEGMPAGVVASAFGPFGLGALRSREWEMVAARQVKRFQSEFLQLSIESELGCCGAAAGAMHLLFGLAVHRHRAWPDGLPEAGPLLAWAISRDGARGICCATVDASAEGQGS